MNATAAFHETLHDSFSVFLPLLLLRSRHLSLEQSYHLFLCIFSLGQFRVLCAEFNKCYNKRLYQS
jgi:hypothetical protein